MHLEKTKSLESKSVINDMEGVKKCVRIKKIENVMVKKLTMIVKKWHHHLENAHRYQEKAPRNLKILILKKWARDFEKPPYIKSHTTTKKSCDRDQKKNEYLDLQKSTPEPKVTEKPPLSLHSTLHLFSRSIFRLSHSIYIKSPKPQLL